MEPFDRLMKLHQIEWRKANVASTRLGRWRGREYPWILPEGSWEEGLWPGIRSGSDNSLPAARGTRSPGRSPSVSECTPRLPRIWRGLPSSVNFRATESDRSVT